MSWTNLQEGWHSRLDPVKDVGLAQMRNCIISDRGGVATRPGMKLRGAANTTGYPTTSLLTAKRRDGTNVMLRTSSTEVEYFWDDTAAPANSFWARLKTGFTSGKVFDGASFYLNTDALDYFYFCNAYEPMNRWDMVYMKTTEATTGGETVIKVDTTLEPNVYFSGTATSATNTTITMPAGTWANDIWNSYYVRITDGTYNHQIRKISDTTSTVLTFDTLTGLTGTTPTFEIRRLCFHEGGTMMINGSTLAYTAPVHDSQLPVSSAPANVAYVPVADYTEELMTNSVPRGNIIRTSFATMFVSGVRAFPTTVYRSKVGDATDYRFSATRAAGEGDVIEFPEDGDRIYDVGVREDQLSVFKDSSIYDLTFTQDASDLPTRKNRVNSPLIGTKGRTFRMGDDILFVSPANEVTSLSRVALRDQQPQRTNLAWPIKYGIRKYDFSDVRGVTFRNYTLIAGKATSDSATNDKIIVFDNNLQRWIGEWDMPIADFTIYKDSLHGASSATTEVYEMMQTDTATVKGTTRLGYDTYAETQWVNKTSDGVSLQKFTTICVTGYVRLNTKVTFSLFYDFGTEPELTWTFDPSATTNADCILGNQAENVLGVVPLGVTPLGFEVTSEETGDHDESRFLVYFSVPYRSHVWTKLGWATSGADKYLEVNDISSNFMEDSAQVPQKLMRSFDD